MARQVKGKPVNKPAADPESFLDHRRIATTITGSKAKRRVNKRTTHCGNLMWRKPSMTIWPVRVPVMVEFWPLAKSAKAKSVESVELATAPAILES